MECCKGWGENGTGVAADSLFNSGKISTHLDYKTMRKLFIAKSRVLKDAYREKSTDAESVTVVTNIMCIFTNKVATIDKQMSNKMN